MRLSKSELHSLTFVATRSVLLVMHSEPNTRSYERERVGFFKTNMCSIESPLYCPSTQAKINGATIVASLSMMNFGVLAPSLPHVIFSLGTAPE
jgi:hypothetical protein